MAEKKLKRMPQIKGSVPRLYDPEAIYNICTAANAYAQAIDFLNEKIEELEKQIEELKNG